ncbi:MAG: sugar phosphate isomerase/epimerase family protein [Phycisphaerae bacterium]
MQRAVLTRVVRSLHSLEDPPGNDDAVARMLDGEEVAVGDLTTAVRVEGDPTAVDTEAGDATKPAAPGFSDVAADVGESARRTLALAAGCPVTDVDSAAALVTGLLRRGGALGATVCSLTLPPLAVSAAAPGFSDDQASLNFTHGLLVRTEWEAQRSGVCLAVEAVSGGGLLSPVELRELIRSVSTWAVGVCLDLSRISQVGRPLDWIATLRGHIHAVRVRIGDRPPGGGTNGGRDVPPAAIARALNDALYAGPVILWGSDDADRLAEAARVLRGSG